VAEDQAEDTFGDYPPFAMTGYSQGGYVVSTNNFYTATNNERDPWRAYDGLTDSDSTNCWGTKTGDSFQTSGEGLAQNNTSGNPDTFIDETGTLHTGHWNKIELPHKLQVDYISIYCELNDVRVPGKVAILGSNDDEKWYLLKDVTTNLDFTTATPQVVPMENNKNKGFKYLILVVKTVPSLNGAVTIREISYYGHRENDLVRLPDPTHVLKYPHIIINEPVKRGYVVSQSSELVPPNSTGSYQGYNIFDGDLVFDGGNTNTPPNGTAWITGNSKYDSSGNPTGTAATTNVTGQNPLSTPGEWFQLELPHKVKLSSIRVMGTTENATNLASRSPVNAVLAGSNDGSTWTTVLTYTNTSWTTLSEFKSFPANVDSTNAYKYFRFIITKNGGNDNASLQAFEFYGTEEATPVPIQIGGGNIDKVANFRVYDKFIGEDQALEIWDAQKDEFGRVKSSMTLQKGRLGIGTTEPEGRLAVLDEPDPDAYGLREYPPKPLAGYKTHIEGHGEFCVSVSSNNTDTYAGWKAFNKIFTGGEGWMSEGDPDTYTQGSGLPNSTTAVFNGKQGEWLHI
jgi:hypothetical protein